MNDPIETEQNDAQTEASKPKTKGAPTKRSKPAKKAGRTKKVAGKPKTERANKKAEVIALMKRAKGATLAEIMAATKCSATEPTAVFDNRIFRVIHFSP